MALQFGGVNVTTFVYGFGTSETVNGMSTVKFGGSGDNEFSVGGNTARMVPRHTIFMPFSNGFIDGFQSGGNEILKASAFAGVGRFITSSTYRIQRTFSMYIARTYIYYKGGGSYNSNGELYIGGTTSSHRVSSACPPVIMVLLQAPGGYGGFGVKAKNWTGSWVQGSGGGGSAGSCSCFQMQLPYDATTAVQVGSYVSTDGKLSFYGPGASTPFISLSFGANGGNGSASINFWSYWKMSSGLGGVTPGSYYTSYPTNFSNATFFSSGGSSKRVITGASGGEGGLTGSGDAFWSSFTPVAGDSLTSESIYFNPDSTKKLTGGTGGAVEVFGGAGGGASMLADGGANDTAGTLGSGGGGGTSQYGKDGGSAVVRFYW